MRSRTGQVKTGVGSIPFDEEGDKSLPGGGYQHGFKGRHHPVVGISRCEGQNNERVFEDIGGENSSFQGNTFQVVVVGHEKGINFHWSHRNNFGEGEPGDDEGRSWSDGGVSKMPGVMIFVHSFGILDDHLNTAKILPVQPVRTNIPEEEAVMKRVQPGKDTGESRQFLHGGGRGRGGKVGGVEAKQVECIDGHQVHDSLVIAVC